MPNKRATRRPPLKAAEWTHLRVADGNYHFRNAAAAIMDLSARMSPISAPQLLSSRLAVVTRGWPCCISSAGRGRGMPMNSKLGLALSEFSKGRSATEPSNEPPLHPSELTLVTRVRSWLGKLAPLVFARYLITFFIGVAAT